MKSIVWFILLPMSFGLLFSSCSTEKRIAKRIDGSWTINSYVITQDSTLEQIELLGLLFSKGYLEFETYDLPSSSGDFSLNLQDIITDSLVVTYGQYELSEDGEMLNLTIGDADNATDVDVDKEKIVIEGILDSAMVRIAADRT